MNHINSIVITLKDDEGFVGNPYNDNLGNPTIGFGTLLPLTETEGVVLLRHRLLLKEKELIEKQPIYSRQSEPVREILLNMAYQLGVGGLLGFRLMWRALDAHDYQEAAKEMLNSIWAKQTMQRAYRLAKLMSEIKD